MKIHIDEPIHQQHHPDGFMPAPEDHNPHGADLLDQQDAPILAEDEVDERTEHLQPAVSPNLEKDKRESPHVIQFPEQKSIRMTSPISDQSLTKVASRELAQSKSRAEGLESISQSVEDVDEYPPLFPNDDKLEKKISAEERFKESEQHPHRFPSQDIWEDAPDSLQLRATVSPPEGFKDETKSPQKEMAKDQQTGQFDSFTTEVSGQQNLVSTDPDAQQQSTSKDIREEAPEGQLLDTTTREPEQSDEAKSPKTDKEKQPAPEIPSRPQRQSPQISPPSQIPPASKNEPTFSPTETRKPPALPERPKPQIPPRPARPPQRTSEDSLTKVTSVGSNDSATSPILKPKPPVPSRPLGSKIAALKAGFMSDLDNRLRLGPQVPKSEEKKEEDKLEAPKGPLKDARKGRARGPVRRKPAVSSQTEEVAKLESSPTFNVTLVEPWSLWSMSPDGVLTLPREDKKMIEKPSKTEQPIEFGNAESTESNLTPEKSAIEEITVEGDRNRDLSEVKPQASVKAPSLSETLDEPAVTTIPVSDLTAAHSPPHVESEPARSTVEVPNKPAVETDLGNATSGEAEKPQTSNAEDVVREAPHRARGNDMDVEPHHDARAEQTSSPDASKESC